MCPTVLNVVDPKVASPIKFLLNSNRISCYLFFVSSYPMLIKSRRHLIFFLHLELDHVVRWEQSRMPMLNSEAPSGELENNTNFHVKCKKKHAFHVWRLGVIWAQTVDMSPYTLSRICITYNIHTYIHPKGGLRKSVSFYKGCYTSWVYLCHSWKINVIWNKVQYNCTCIILHIIVVCVVCI